MLGEKVAKNIKKYRKERGLTQKELGKKINKSLRMVQKYEANDVNPDLDMIENIAEALDIFVYKLFSYESGMTVGVSVKDTEQFKLLAYTLGEILTDDRVPEEVRQEHYNNYLKKVSELNEGEGGL